MYINNPFAALTDVLPAQVMQIYLIVMVLAVVLGTLFDVWHKGSARYFARRQEESRARAERELSGGDRFTLALHTVGEAAVSGEFCKWPRRASHLLMMYGFIIYVVTTVIIVFFYPGVPRLPSIVPAFWAIGQSMVLIGGLWFFFFLRVNVAYDGDSPFHVGRADLFVGSLILSVLFGLLWSNAAISYVTPACTWTLFGLYIFFTTVLFVTVPWSKFAHMFFKPTVAYQRRVEEANGSTDLPRPTNENFIVNR